MLKELKLEPREKNISMVIDTLTKTMLTKPVPEWGRVLDEEDYPRDYYYVFAAIVVNLFAFTIPTWILIPFITILA